MTGGIGLQTGLRALLASRLVLDTIGHNVANANTPGYSRQAADLGSARPLLAGGRLLGNGVDVQSVRRTVDALLQRRLLQQGSVRGRLESRFTGLSEVEALLREPDGSSLGGRLDGFFGAVSSLSTNPADSILRTGMVNSAGQLSAQFNQLTQSLSSIRRDSAREVQLRVDEVNRLAAEISGLNREISSAQSAGLAPNDLADRRDLAVSKLAALVDLTAQEDATGAVRVLVGGSTLVSPTRFHRMRATADALGSVSLSIEGATGTLKTTGGSLGGLVSLTQASVPDLQEDLDKLARALIREVNRVHSTGVPAGGSYTSLRGASTFVDVDGDGSFRDELLSNAGLPFDVAGGELFVNVVNRSSGALERHRIAISRTHTTVGGFLDALGALPHLAAEIDGAGRLQIVADAGFGFDFSARLDKAPDHVGSFGGGAATLSTAAAEPFALADGDTLDLSVGGAPVSITFSGADFARIGEATAEEIAAVIRADAGALANGITAAAVNGRLVVRSVGSGSSASFTPTGGAAATALGWTGVLGTPVTGHDSPVSVTVSGSYAGDVNDSYTFVARQDGTVGTTAGLSVDVLDAGGQRIATLDIGAGYVPGTPIEVANGVSVAFGLGQVSAAHNDFFQLDALADSDTSEVLVAVGLGAFFSGTGAADIAVDRDIALDPTRIASSVSGADGDNRTLLDLVDLEALDLSDLGRASLGAFYGDIVGRVGFETASTVDSLQANEALVQSLELRREEISGVNVDEELVDLLRFEQAFEAASRYIATLNELNDELLALL